MNNLYFQSDRTIVAQSTPEGPGALAIIRISGSACFDVCKNFIALLHNKSLLNVPSHTIHYCTILDKKTGSKIDNVMCAVMKAPHTFTGKDTIEITCHNNRFIIQKIITLALLYGAKPAEHGEFTKWAVLHEKIDLLQAEAINELIIANNEYLLKKSLAQVDGSLSQQLALLETYLLQIIALCQASFEFVEEEGVSFDVNIKEEIERVKRIIEQLSRSDLQQKQLRNGIRIVLLGPVNAGKSSLFNAIIGEKKAIVTPIEGTTRDYIEAGIYIEGFYVTMIDTAGIRTTHDLVEQEGILRSLEQAQTADIIILVYDQTKTTTHQCETFYTEITNKYDKKTIRIGSKCDLNTAINDAECAFDSLVSIYDESSIINLKKIIFTKIQFLFTHDATSFLLNKRQHAIIQTIVLQFNDTLDLITTKKCIPYELVVHHIQNILIQVAQLTGKSIAEAAMDKIFKDFCVGK